LTDPVTLNSYWSFLKNRKLLIKGKAGQWTGGGFFTAFADERPKVAYSGDIDNEFTPIIMAIAVAGFCISTAYADFGDGLMSYYPLNGDAGDWDGYTENQGDCNDEDPNIYAGATETCGDGIDQNCHGCDKPCPAGVSYAVEDFVVLVGDTTCGKPVGMNLEKGSKLE
jgi:hypothetical protein